MNFQIAFLRVLFILQLHAERYKKGEKMKAGEVTKRKSSREMRKKESW
jgi:hypothetical protein